MHAVVAAQVEPRHRGRGHGPGGVLARRGSARAVVVRVGWTSSRSAPGGRADRGQAARVPALAEVDDALEHRSSLSLTRARWRPWYGDAVNLGAPELLIVLLVILVLFGGSKLPKLARSLGQAQSEFKEG